MNVLDQVRLVKRREQNTFEPLLTCLSSASELNRAIAQVSLPDLHPEVGALANETHPLTLFMSLIRDRQQLKEEKIAVIQV